MLDASAPQEKGKIEGIKMRQTQKRSRTAGKAWIRVKRFKVRTKDPRQKKRCRKKRSGEKRAIRVWFLVLRQVAYLSLPAAHSWNCSTRHEHRHMRTTSDEIKVQSISIILSAQSDSNSYRLFCWPRGRSDSGCCCDASESLELA